MASKALFSALDLSIFTTLSNKSLSMSEMKTKLPEGVATSGLETLLTCLVSLGLLQKDGDRFSNVAAAEAFLVRGAKYDFGDYLRFQIDKQMYPFMEHCSTVLQGKPSPKATDYEEWMSDADEARLYTESQHSGSTGPARGLSKKKPGARCFSASIHVSSFLDARWLIPIT
jgi:hypothetical protein